MVTVVLFLHMRTFVLNVLQIREDKESSESMKAVGFLIRATFIPEKQAANDTKCHDLFFIMESMLLL